MACSFPLSTAALYRVLRAAGVTHARADRFADALRTALDAHELTSRAQISHFLAQTLHESARLKYVRELWGPTRAQSRYEGRRDLGNNYPGDGTRFMGRGIIQLTGRANYRSFTAAIREKYGADSPDFEAEPQLVEQPRWAVESALWYWHARVEQYANGEDVRHVRRVTKAVNGGTNGLQDRMDIFMQVGKALRQEGL